MSDQKEEESLGTPNSYKACEESGPRGEGGRLTDSPEQPSWCFCWKPGAALRAAGARINRVAGSQGRARPGSELRPLGARVPSGVPRGSPFPGGSFLPAAPPLGCHRNRPARPRPASRSPPAASPPLGIGPRGGPVPHGAWRRPAGGACSVLPGTTAPPGGGGKVGGLGSDSGVCAQRHAWGPPRDARWDIRGDIHGPPRLRQRQTPCSTCRARAAEPATPASPPRMNRHLPNFGDHSGLEEGPSK
ncbi:uncharacterized protein RHO17_008109 [Thomomys bottae]